jgi:hypothetical protein
MRRTTIYLVALVLAVTACSGETAEESTTTTEPTTTTTNSTTTTTAATTTTVDPRPRSPLTGLPVDDATTLNRRVLSVKLDNHPTARPQSGVQEADAMMEVVVEGGLTRLIALFHHSDSGYVGPIRSGRPSDAALIRPLESTLAISGGQAWVRAGINAIGVEYISDPRPGMFRISGRRSPHNLYGDTLELREVADNRGISDEPPPSGLYEFGDLPDDREPATSLDLTFSSRTRVVWEWDGEGYVRTIDGSPSTWRAKDGTTEQIAADTLVVVVGRFYTASPPAGTSGSSVPATETVGTGRVFVLSGGELVQGTWQRDRAEAPFVFTTLEGEPLPVPPGMPWISIVPDGGAVVWSS